MNLQLNVNIPAITVFIQGLLSFFSPCVLPLIPVYMGYLSGGTNETDEFGNVHFNRKKVLINTLFFVIGVSFAFFLLGFVMTSVGRFFSGNQLLFARIGGIIVIIFGLYQLGILGTSRVLSGEYRLRVGFEKMSASPLTALLMGFVLSFAWTPCVGPALSAVLIMASTAATAGTGFMLIAVYTLGYVIPFIFVGMFTTQLLDYFGKHRDIVRYTVKIGGALMILMGILMLTGSMNRITGYMSSISSIGSETNEAVVENSLTEEASQPNAGSESPDTAAGQNEKQTNAESEQMDTAADQNEKQTNAGPESPNTAAEQNEKQTNAESEQMDTAADQNEQQTNAGPESLDTAADQSESRTNAVSEHTGAVVEDQNKNQPNADSEPSNPAASTQNEPQPNADSETSSTPSATQSDSHPSDADEDPTDESEDTEYVPAPKFALTDQYGTSHNLSDYRGKILFLNFWATWCPPCRAELPYIQELYEEYQEAGDESVAFVGCTFPESGQETDIEGIKEFLDNNGYSFPVLFDESGALAQSYYITAFPTTFIINPDGDVLGYIPGSMTKEIMEDVIAQAKELSGL